MIRPTSLLIRSRTSQLALVGLVGCAFAACTSGAAVIVEDNASATVTSTTGSGGSGAAGSGGSAAGGGQSDADNDGYTTENGDCDDMNANVNPGAVELENGFDDDCDDLVDEAAFVCDSTLPVDSDDAVHAASALGLCKVAADQDDWGLISAEWILPAGEVPPTDANALAAFHLGHGVVTAFGAGVVPREGDALLALSSGTARDYMTQDWVTFNGYDKDYTSNHPAGFPRDSAACPGVTTGAPHDGTGVKLVLRAPSNATGVAFDYNFYTYEWPNSACDVYNDFFVASMSPAPMGALDGLIAFDSQLEPVSVRSNFLQVCDCPGGAPCMVDSISFDCSLGATLLQGTGFGGDTEGGLDHAATGWLTTVAPVDAGDELTLELSTYDSEDGFLDSLTVLDNLRFVGGAAVTVGTTRISD